MRLQFKQHHHLLQHTIFLQQRSSRWRTTPLTTCLAAVVEAALIGYQRQLLVYSLLSVVSLSGLRGVRSCGGRLGLGSHCSSVGCSILAFCTYMHRVIPKTTCDEKCFKQSRTATTRKPKKFVWSPKRKTSLTNGGQCDRTNKSTIVGCWCYGMTLSTECQHLEDFSEWFYYVYAKTGVDITIC